MIYRTTVFPAGLGDLAAEAGEHFLLSDADPFVLLVLVVSGDHQIYQRLQLFGEHPGLPLRDAPVQGLEDDHTELSDAGGEAGHGRSLDSSACVLQERGVGKEQI